MPGVALYVLATAFAFRRARTGFGGAIVVEGSSWQRAVANMRGPCSSNSIHVWYSSDLDTVPCPYCGCTTRSPGPNSRMRSPSCIINPNTFAAPKHVSRRHGHSVPRFRSRLIKLDRRGDVTR